MQIVLKTGASRSMEGKLSFIDLAGSERGADRGDTNAKTRYVFRVALSSLKVEGTDLLLFVFLYQIILTHLPVPSHLP
jgi:hypothetical protein